jgi:antitoxin VapB
MANKTGKRGTTKVFTAGSSQTVHLLKESHVTCDEVTIGREDEPLVLTPRSRSWRDYFAASQRFSDDYPDDIADAPACNARNPDG